MHGRWQGVLACPVMQDPTGTAPASASHTHRDSPHWRASIGAAGTPQATVLLAFGVASTRSLARGLRRRARQAATRAALCYTPVAGSVPKTMHTWDAPFIRFSCLW